VAEGDAGHDVTPQDPARRPDRRWLRRGTAGLVALVLVAAAASYRFDLGDRLHGRDDPSPVSEPARVPPPAGLALPPARTAPAVAAATPEGDVDGRAVRRALAGLVAGKKLGPHVRVEVAQLSDGTVVYRHGTGTVTPASTMKLLTTVAALSALGPSHRFATTAVTGPGARRVVLVGGGDPLLARAPTPGYPHRADLDTLAAGTARALRAHGRHRVRLGFDTSLFTGPEADPRWEPSYLPDSVISPVSPLWVEEGRDPDGYGDRVARPALEAADAFATALRRHGIAVTGDPVQVTAPSAGSGGRVVARVQGAPLSQVVQHVVEVSDNEGAEVLSHQVAVAEHQPASFAGGARAVRAVLRRLGISTRGDRIYDGSGLSRDDRLLPATLLAVVRTALSPRHPGLRSSVVNLPVAGFTGSLASRFDTGDPAGPGRVRAKTGTLTGVHGLVGTVTSTDGAVMEFVALADRVRPVNTLDARQRIDEVAAALAGCSCAGGSGGTP
jgi:D-alanyl-D-alanine carboxypeptidase/D-alanyl-D-alanine-endopeptidase (penicillin-binding protein 4)